MDDLSVIVATLAGPLTAEVAKRWDLTREAAVAVNTIATVIFYVLACLLLHGADPAYLADYAQLGLAAGGASSGVMNLLYRARAARTLEDREKNRVWEALTARPGGLLGGLSDPQNVRQHEAGNQRRLDDTADKRLERDLKPPPPEERNGGAE